MTNTPMSERERATKEALEMALKCFTGAVYGSTYHVETQSKIKAALRAYNPKPEPVPVIPAWEEFVKDKPVQQWGIGQAPVAVMVGRVAIHRDHFDAIREALSKSKAPTE